MKKIILIFGIFVTMVSFVLADYNYYDDFDSYNTTAWYLHGGGFTINSRVASMMNCYQGGQGYLDFIHPDFDFSNDYVIEYAINYSATYPHRYFYITNQTSDIGTNYYMNYVAYVSDSNKINLYEVVNGTITNHAQSPNNSPNNAVVKVIKTNNDNGTFDIETYWDGISIQTQTSANNWQDGSLLDFDNLFFFCHQNTNNQYSLDWINITTYVQSEPQEVDRSFGSRRRRSKASRTALIEAPVELEPVKETEQEGFSDGQKLVVVALGGVVAYSIFTAKPKPKRIKRRKR